MRAQIPKLVTAPEAARRLGVPREDAIEAICEGRLKAIRVRFGHRVLEMIFLGGMEKMEQLEKLRTEARFNHDE